VSFADDKGFNGKISFFPSVVSIVFIAINATISGEFHAEGIINLDDRILTLSSRISATLICSTRGVIPLVLLSSL